MSDACGGLFHSSSDERNGYGENIYYCGGNNCYSAERAMNGFCEFVCVVVATNELRLF